MARGERTLDHFLTTARLAALVANGDPFSFMLSDSNEMAVAVGARHRKIERWDLLQLDWAPA